MSTSSAPGANGKNHGEAEPANPNTPELPIFTGVAEGKSTEGEERAQAAAMDETVAERAEPTRDRFQLQLGLPRKNRSRCPRRFLVLGILAVGGAAVLWLGFGGQSFRDSDAQPGSEAIVHIPSGALFSEVVDSLVAHQVVVRPAWFQLYARWQGQDRLVKAGTYRLSRNESFTQLLEVLTQGRVETIPTTFPEGMTLSQMTTRIARAAGVDSATVALTLADDSAHLAWGLPGPGLEGYLFPDTYRFAEGVGLDRVLEAMVGRHMEYWSSKRREQLSASGMSQREVVTLASIVQAEARIIAEMPRIAGVYHNRLRIGMPLQADPTVLYALGGTRPRLLFAAIDSVADNPYNTYTHNGLPPGPIGAPGEAALDATLNPEEHDFLYFVARPNGEHIFTRSLREHNNARIQVRREVRQGNSN